MPGSTCVNPPMCLEWKTELPGEYVSLRTSNISLGCSHWFLELIYDHALKEYRLILCHLKSMNMVLNEPVFVTTFVQKPSPPHKPILVDFRSISQRIENTLWSKTRKQILEKIPDIFGIGKLTLFCLFNYAETHLQKTNASIQTTARLQTLSSDFSTFLKDETFSDVQLICEDRTFSAHRCILAARSEVFAAMFRNKMAETEAGVVHIKDMDPDVLELLLDYVYSGEMPDLSESTACRLYEAADKYAVHSLRDACSDRMLECQTPENCLDLLVLADEHSDKKFVEAVVCFAAEHLGSLSVESWSTFKERYPLLVLPVLEKRLKYSLPRVT